MSFHVWVVTYWLGFDLTLGIWDSLITNIVILGSSLVLTNVLMSYAPPWGKAWFAPCLSFFLSLLFQWVIQDALRGIGEGNTAYLEFVEKSEPIRWAFYFVVITGVSVSSVFFSQLKEQEEAAQRVATTASMVRKAELQKLQVQLQPHFLFNCLNSINALILAKSAEASKMVQYLSDFLRITLRRADEHWITLEEEWNYIQLYLEIEKVRFGHRLEVKTSFEEGTMHWKIPTLLLQPLVENAIKFGLYGTTDKVVIEMEATVTNEMMQVRVTNPFDADMQPPKGSGFGLSGMRRRLYLLFARNDLLETRMDQNVFTVTLKLPKQL